MSFPNIIFGPEGEQFHRYTAKRWPLGTALWLKGGDQRFRFAGTGAAANGIAGGRLCQGEALSSQWDTFTNALPFAVGQTTASVQSAQANSTFAANKFTDGWLIAMTSTVSTPGLYRIISHAAQPTTGVATKFTIQPGLIDAYSSGTTFALHQNDFKDVVISSTGAAPGARIAGVTPTSLSSAAFGWLQTAGPAAVLSDGSIAIGNGVVPSTAVAGAVRAPTSADFVAFSANAGLVLGEVMAQTTTTKFGLVMLRIDG